MGILACAASPNQPSRALLNHAAEQEEQELLHGSAGTLPRGAHRTQNKHQGLPASPRYGNTHVVCTLMGEDEKATGLEISGCLQIRAHAAAASISNSSAATCAPCSMQAHVPPRAAVEN